MKHPQEIPVASNRKDEDDAFFCILMKNQLRLVPVCDFKDDLRFNIQQMVVACKRQVKNFGISSSNLRQNKFISLLSSPPAHDLSTCIVSSASNSSSLD